MANKIRCGIGSWARMRRTKQKPLRFGRGRRSRCFICRHGADRGRSRRSWSRESGRLADESRLQDPRVCQGRLPSAWLASVSGPQRRPVPRLAARRPNCSHGEPHGLILPCLFVLPNRLPHRPSAARTVRNPGIDGSGTVCHTIHTHMGIAFPSL
jgi:hypothetical protein